MDLHTLNQLLWRTEGDTLDFKSEQYKLGAVSDYEKSKLLKDILAFANAWRSSPAYVIIGVKEKRGERAEVLGIHELYDDANFQDFVNAHTNRPIKFSYECLRIEDKTIGVITIPTQTRPFYVAKDYGQAKANFVYLRRGSSTDEATMEEVAAMGREDVARSTGPLVDVSFYRKRDGTSVSELTANIEIFDLPSHIPDYTEDLPLSFTFANTNFYRELAAYYKQRGEVAPLYFVARNLGATTANDVTAVMTILNERNELLVRNREQLPSKPSKQRDIGLPMSHSIFESSNYSIKSIPGGHEIELEIGKLQPKQVRKFDEPLFIGAKDSGLVEIAVRIFSDELSEPIVSTLRVTLSASRKALPFEIPKSFRLRR